MVPGAPEREATATRQRNGIPIKLAVWRDLLHVHELLTSSNNTGADTAASSSSSRLELPLQPASLAELRRKLEQGQ